MSDARSDRGPRSARPPVDAATLADLRDLGVDEFRALVPLFVEDSARRIDGMHRGLIDDVLVGMAAAAHSLRGSCSAFGALVLADLCTDLERLMDDTGDRWAAAELVSAIEAEFGRVRDALADAVEDATA